MDNSKLQCTAVNSLHTEIQNGLCNSKKEDVSFVVVLHRPGIEPGSRPWQGRILPLDQRCLEAVNPLFVRCWLWNLPVHIAVASIPLSVLQVAAHLGWTAHGAKPNLGCMTVYLHFYVFEEENSILWQADCNSSTPLPPSHQTRLYKQNICTTILWYYCAVSVTHSTCCHLLW